MPALKVLGNQGVVRGLQPVLHGQVQRGRGFAAATDTDQNHVGAGQVAVALAVVMRQGKVDGLNPVVVFLALGSVRKATHPVVGFDAQFALQRRDKDAKHVQQHAVALRFDHGQHFHIDQRCEDDGAPPFNLGRVVDLAHRLVRFVHAVNKRQPDMARLDLKLGQDGVAKCLSGDAGAVGDEKYGAMGHVGCPVEVTAGRAGPALYNARLSSF